MAFKSLVKTHLASLLESKRKYWKQRNTVRWVTLGDENTSFFRQWLLIVIPESILAAWSLLMTFLSPTMSRRLASFGMLLKQDWVLVTFKAFHTI